MNIFLKIFRLSLPFLWILVVLLIPIMKVVGIIDWTWWTVTLAVAFPVWLPAALVFGLTALIITVVIFISLYKVIFVKW